MKWFLLTISTIGAIGLDDPVDNSLLSSRDDINSNCSDVDLELMSRCLDSCQIDTFQCYSNCDNPVCISNCNRQAKKCEEGCPCMNGICFEGCSNCNNLICPTPVFVIGKNLQEWKQPLVVNKIGQYSQNVSFQIGAGTDLDRACSVEYRNQFYVFGGQYEWRQVRYYCI